MLTLRIPMVRVSEAFEYDMQRAFNVPIIINRSEKHFGKQLHVHNLEWGFRVHGTVISMLLVISLVMVFLGSLVAIVGQTMTDLLG